MINLLNGERLRKLRERQVLKTGRKVTGREAARLLGLDNTDNYYPIEYGRRTLKRSEAEILAKAWGEDPDDFFVKEGDPELLEPERPRPTTTIPSQDVPLIGPTRGGPWESPIDSDDTIAVPAAFVAHDCYASFLVGDSMEPYLYEGDLMILREATRRTPPEVNDVVQARNASNDLTVKQLKHDGQAYYLHPLNPEHEDIQQGEEWKVIGILVAFRHGDEGDEVWRHNPKRLKPRKI